MHCGASEEEALEDEGDACFNKIQCCGTPQPDSTFAYAISELFETKGKTVVIGLWEDTYSTPGRFDLLKVKYNSTSLP